MRMSVTRDHQQYLTTTQTLNLMKAQKKEVLRSSRRGNFQIQGIIVKITMLRRKTQMSKQCPKIWSQKNPLIQIRAILLTTPMVQLMMTQLMTPQKRTMMSMIPPVVMMTMMTDHRELWMMELF